MSYDRPLCYGNALAHREPMRLGYPEREGGETEEERRRPERIGRNPKAFSLEEGPCESELFSFGGSVKVKAKGDLRVFF